MTLDDLRYGLDLWGSDLSRWPAAQRQAAQALIDQDQAAAAEWRLSQRADAFFCAHDPASAMPSIAVQRMMNNVTARIADMGHRGLENQMQAPCQIRRRTLWQKLSDSLDIPEMNWAVWLPRFAATAALAAMLGVYAGGMMPMDGISGQSAADVVAMLDYSSLMGL